MSPAHRPKGSHFRKRFYGQYANIDQHPSHNVRRLETFAHTLLGKPQESVVGMGMLGKTPARVRGAVYSSLMGSNTHPYRDILLLEMMVLFAHHHSLNNTELRKLAQSSLKDMSIFPPRRSEKKS